MTLPTQGRTVHWVADVAVGATVLLAGGHYVYYLYHWEWVRAQIAGLALIAGLVVAAVRLVLARIDRMHRDLAGRLAEPQASVVRPADGRLPGPPRPRDSRAEFPWLAREASPPRYRAVLPLAALAATVPVIEQPQPAVFIPILLGAGLAASAVAALVERASTALHRDVRVGLRQLALGTVACVALVGVTIAGIWYWSHDFSRPLAEGRTELTVDVDSQTVPRPAEQTVGLIGSYCARNAIARVTVREVRPVSEDSAILVLSPVLDEQSQRRYGGCLQDANLERHRLTVTGTILVPEEVPEEGTP